MTDAMQALGAEIELAGVRKSWSGATAVKGVDLTMPAGRFTALLGPSGCGKSTTLRLISGLETPDAGSVRIGGRDVTASPPAERNLSMVFQSYGLFPHLSVAENIVFGLRTRRTPRAERETRLAEVAALLELSAYLDRKPGQLSGGQQQRVALGRAIISRRPVCLMDEPLSNLDARLRHEMRVEIRALQRKLGLTMVYVTHDQVEAITMADQVALMNEGRIEQAATPREIYERPETVFAARFVGTPPMNLLAPAAFGAQAAGLADADILIGLRPERLTLDPAGALEARALASEFLGAETLIDCAVEGMDGERFTVKAPGDVAVEPGGALRFGFGAGDLHVFDQGTGRRRDDLAPRVAAALGAPRGPSGL